MTLILNRAHMQRFLANLAAALLPWHQAMLMIPHYHPSPILKTKGNCFLVFRQQSILRLLHLAQRYVIHDFKLYPSRHTKRNLAHSKM